MQQLRRSATTYLVARQYQQLLKHLSHTIALMQPLEDFGPILIDGLLRLRGVQHIVLATNRYGQKHLEFPYVVIDGKRVAPDELSSREHLLHEALHWHNAGSITLDLAGTGKWYAFPLRYAGSTVGVLAIGPVEAAQQHAEVLQSCAELLGTALYLLEYFGSLEHAFAEQATRLADISEIARQLNATLDGHHVAEVVLINTLGIAADRSAAVFLRGPEQRLSLAAHRHVREERVARWQADGLSVAQIETAITEPEYQIAPSERLPSDLRLRSEPSTHGIFPLRHEDNLLGVLLVATSHEGDLTPTDARFLQQLAAHASLALSNAKAYEAINAQHTLLNRRMAQLQAVSRISQAISAHLNLQALLPEIVAVVQSTLGYRSALLSLVEVGAPDTVRRVAAVGVPDEMWQQFRDQLIPLSHYEKLMVEQFRISNSYYIPHDRIGATGVDDSMFLDQYDRAEFSNRGREEWNLDDLLLVPLYGHRGNLVGILSVDDPIDCQRPTPENITVLEIFAMQAATAIENVRVYTAVEQQALTDNLTGLANQRHVMMHIAQHISWAERHQQGLAVLALDIDHFKSYNDTFGHLAGNVVLREFAEILRQNVRTSDIVARWGGEEFLALLPHSTRDGAIEVAERVREAIQHHSFPHRAITVSIGVAMIAGNMRDQDILAAADAALYRAKVTRNAVSL